VPATLASPAALALAALFVTEERRERGSDDDISGVAALAVAVGEGAVTASVIEGEVSEADVRDCAGFGGGVMNGESAVAGDEGARYGEGGAGGGIRDAFVCAAVAGAATGRGTTTAASSGSGSGSASVGVPGSVFASPLKLLSAERRNDSKLLLLLLLLLLMSVSCLDCAILPLSPSLSLSLLASASAMSGLPVASASIVGVTTADTAAQRHLQLSAAPALASPASTSKGVVLRPLSALTAALTGGLGRGWAAATSVRSASRSCLICASFSISTALFGGGAACACGCKCAFPWYGEPEPEPALALCWVSAASEGERGTAPEMRRLALALPAVLALAPAVLVALTLWPGLEVAASALLPALLLLLRAAFVAAARRVVRSSIRLLWMTASRF